MFELNKIYLGDCLELMKKIPDKSINLVLTDPPYNISKKNDNRDRSKMNSPIMRRKKALNYDFGKWDNMGRKEFLEFTDKWLFECCRVLKENGTIISFFNKEDISYLGWQAVKYGIRTRVIFTWHKTNPVPSSRKVNYLSACEFAWIGSYPNWTFNFKYQKDMHNFFETGNKSGYGETDHPTEKPKKLISHWIEIHSKPDDLILDPFSGSGTTAVACIGTGRNFICIEKDPEYYSSSVKRIEKIISRGKIDDMYKTNKRSA